MRSAWARGVNFDAQNLTFYTASPGFIIGESIIGVDELGGAGPDEVLPATFTSLGITSPTTVEAGLFVHREVETCQLTATLPDSRDLRGRWIAVHYFEIELYRGRITQIEWSETVEVDAEYKPGNTAVKTHRFTLVATNDEEVLAGRNAPPRNFTNETLVERIESWLDLPVTVEDPADDLPVNWSNAGWDTSAVRRLVFAADAPRPLLDVLRDETRLRNMTFIYQPLSDPQFVLKPNNQWLIGDGDTALVFTDDPAQVSGQATDPDDEFVHLGRYIGYTSRNIGEDKSLFTNAVTIRWGQYDVESPPANGPVETTYGPYRASGANQRDTVVDLGTLDVAAPGSNPYWLSRAVTGILPLQANPGPYTRSLATPLQSTKQLEGTVPGMALLIADSSIVRVAVLGRQHQVTPSKWMVQYTLGPPHLLDRSSDFDPGTPEVHPAVAGPGGGQTTFEWVVPEYPSDVTVYEVRFTSPASTRLITSDQSLIGVADYDVALPAGSTRQLIVSGVAGTGYWVLYTSNPAAGTVNPSVLWREGQPAFLGVVL